MINSFGVFQDYYSRFFLTNYTPSQIGWIGSVQLFLQFFLGIPAGLLFDEGYFYPMVVIASVLYNFSYVWTTRIIARHWPLARFYMLSLAKPQQLYQVFLAHGVGVGLALGFLFLPALALMAHHFQRRRTLAMGIVMSGSSVGGVVFPIMLKYVSFLSCIIWLTYPRCFSQLIKSHGFPYATRAAAYLCTGMMILAISLMRTRLPPRSKRPDANVPKPSLGVLLKDVKYVLSLIGWGFLLGLRQPSYLEYSGVMEGLGIFFPGTYS